MASDVHYPLPLEFSSGNLEDILLVEHSNEHGIDPTHQQNQKQVTPELLYKVHFRFLYETLENFAPQEAWASIKDVYAQKLRAEIGPWAEGRYARLGVYRILYQTLFERNDLLEYLDLSFETAFALWLRDRYELSPSEIAAIVDSSDGSVRTRLLKGRRHTLERLRSLHPLEIKLPSSNENSAHFCIQAQERIENWNPSENLSGATGGAVRVVVPQGVANSVGTCANCAVYLESRTLGSIHGQKKIPLSTDEQDAEFPLGSLIIKKEHSLALNWEAAPWYLKILLEGLMATSLVVGIVLAAPRIKSLYELWLERRFDLYSITEIAANLSSEISDTGAAQTENTEPAEEFGPESPTPEEIAANTRNAKKRGQPTRPQQEKLAIQAETEFGGNDAYTAASAKVHRVFLKTDSPESLSEKVFEILRGVEHHAFDASIPLGSEIPGGVLFDVFVPVKSYASVINQIAKLGDSKLIITVAKEKIIPGKARVRIWIQRI